MHKAYLLTQRVTRDTDIQLLKHSRRAVLAGHRIQDERASQPHVMWVSIWASATALLLPQPRQPVVRAGGISRIAPRVRACAAEPEVHTGHPNPNPGPSPSPSPNPNPNPNPDPNPNPAPGGRPRVTAGARSASGRGGGSP